MTKSRSNSTQAFGQRTGRRNNSDRIRELVSLLASLSSTGDSVTIDAISSRLGISQEEARDMMNIVCEASGEDMGGLLISSNDDETEYTLQYPGNHGRPIRLTIAETIAVAHALDAAGIAEDDPLRQRLSTGFYSKEVAIDEVRKALGAMDKTDEALYICARSMGEGREVRFMYRGLKDSAARKRRTSVLSLSTNGKVWYADAYDLDLEQNRRFRTDRMTNAVLGGMARTPQTTMPDTAHDVGITFLDRSYYIAFEWPGLHDIHEEYGEIHGRIPYYGECSTWLLRRICAGSGSIIVDDESIMQSAREYARHELERAL